MLVKKFTVTVSILIALSLITMKLASASSLNLTVVTDKQVYNVGEKVYISGNLTEDGLPVSDAIVAVEVDNPKGDIFVIRTLNTGPVNQTQWPIEILELFPCDSGGNPKYNFQPGDSLAFKIKTKSNAANPLDIMITLCIIYSNKAPFTVRSPYVGSIGAGQTITITTSPISIPKKAVTGNTTIYANVYNVLPKNNGFAYCPETSTSFIIGAGGSGQPASNSTGQFTLEISLSQIAVWLGNYTIYGTAKYSFSVAFSTSTFEVILIGDVYPDGKIDMRDIAIVARAFGTEALQDP